MESDALILDADHVLEIQFGADERVAVVRAWMLFQELVGGVIRRCGRPFLRRISRQAVADALDAMSDDVSPLAVIQILGGPARVIVPSDDEAGRFEDEGPAAAVAHGDEGEHPVLESGSMVSEEAVDQIDQVPQDGHLGLHPRAVRVGPPQGASPGVCQITHPVARAVVVGLDAGHRGVVDRGGLIPFHEDPGEVQHAEEHGGGVVPLIGFAFEDLDHLPFICLCRYLLP